MAQESTNNKYSNDADFKRNQDTSSETNNPEQSALESFYASSFSNTNIGPDSEVGAKAGAGANASAGTNAGAGANGGEHGDAGFSSRPEYVKEEIYDIPEPKPTFKKCLLDFWNILKESYIAARAEQKAQYEKDLAKAMANREKHSANPYDYMPEPAEKMSWSQSRTYGKYGNPNADSFFDKWAYGAQNKPMNKGFFDQLLYGREGKPMNLSKIELKLFKKDIKTHCRFIVKTLSHKHNLPYVWRILKVEHRLPYDYPTFYYYAIKNHSIHSRMQDCGYIPKYTTLDENKDENY